MEMVPTEWNGSCLVAFAKEWANVISVQMESHCGFPFKNQQLELAEA